MLLVNEWIGWSLGKFWEYLLCQKTFFFKNIFFNFFYYCHITHNTQYHQPRITTHGMMESTEPPQPKKPKQKRKKDIKTVGCVFCIPFHPPTKASVQEKVGWERWDKLKLKVITHCPAPNNTHKVYCWSDKPLRVSQWNKLAHCFYGYNIELFKIHRTKSFYDIAGKTAKGKHVLLHNAIKVSSNFFIYFPLEIF